MWTPGTFAPVRPVDDMALNILQKRYFHTGEICWDDVVDRVILHVMAGENIHTQAAVREMLQNRWFIPNSPTLFNAGIRDAGLSACFVVDMPDTTEGIMKTFSDFVHVARRGGGCGVSLSNIRPEGSPVAGSSHGYAAGPVAIYDALCHLMQAFTQGGKRAMAQMGTLSVYHPDIIKFIHAKEAEGVMSTTNISVVVDDEFMYKVERDETYWTEFNGVRYEELNARDVFQQIVEGAWRNGEPGLIFDNKVNDGPYAGTGQKIMATNPCGEQGLPPNGVCNLGSLDISKFLIDGKLDYDRLGLATRLAIRFLDNVIEHNTYPTPEITEWALRNRPVGLGILGFADYLILKGIAYGSQESLTELSDILGYMYSVAKITSQELGRERGVPEECQKLPQHRRNITLLSIAPTGTISLIAGCSSGIEPVFSEITVRTDKTGTYQMTHPMAHEPFFRCAVAANGATEVSWQEHVAVQDMAQRWVDSGVSKTVNVPNHTWRETVLKALMEAWKSPHIKGVTIYRSGSRSQEVLTPKNLKKDKCPVCGADLVKESGCKHCSQCDFSVCEIGQSPCASQISML